MKDKKTLKEEGKRGYQFTSYGEQIEMRRLREEEGKTAREIAEICKKPISTIERFFCENKIYSQRPDDVVKRFGKRPLFESELHNIERSIIANYFKRKKPSRILTICDAHYPFQDNKIIDEALNQKADVVVIAGDGPDFYSLSQFRKSKLVSYIDEINDYYKFLELLCKKYEDVVILESNHELRLWKLLQDRLGDHASILEWLKDKADPFKDMAKTLGFKLVSDWWLQIGDVIWAHPDWFSNITLRTTENTLDYFFKWGIFEWSCLLNAHTHKCGYGIKFGKVLIENGCCCRAMDYLKDGRKRLEIQKGFSIIAFDKKGRFDFNSSRLFHFKDKS